MTNILSDAERYGDIERILSAPEPLCFDAGHQRRVLNRNRRGFVFGFGARARQATAHRASVEARHLG